MVEEAAEIVEPHVVAAIPPSAKRLIMIGDHQQLRPKFNNYELQVCTTEPQICGHHPDHAISRTLHLAIQQVANTCRCAWGSFLQSLAGLLELPCRSSLEMDTI
jgi:hypothetical protein